MTSKSIAVLLLTLAVLFARDPEPVRQAPRPLDPGLSGIGRHIKFPVQPAGKITLIAVTSETCPLSRRYAPKLERLRKVYGEKGVAFATLKANGRRSLLRRLGAKTTTDVFVLDARGVLRYRGAIDDQYGIGYALEAARKHYLRDALDALLAKRPVPVAATWAPGCALNLAGSDDDAAPTYHGRVQRILQDNCQVCHRDGENAPFPLTSYAAAKDHAAMMAWTTHRKLMPPWFAGKDSLPMSNDRRLSDADRAALKAWSRAGCPKGDPKNAPPKRRWAKGWKIGTPDVIYEIPRIQRVPAEGTVEYVHVRVPTTHKTDRWIQALEIRPTAPQVVHHALVFLRYPRGHKLYTRRPSDRDGLGGYFAGMVPGQGHVVYRAGLAKKLPAGARFVFQIHYTTNGKAAADRTRLGLRFAPQPPQREVRTTGIATTRFSIPPGAQRHPVHARIRVPMRATLHGLMPHMHVRGTAFRYVLIDPGGKKRTLLDVPRYDFNWQLYYRLQKPLTIEPGSVIEATGWYDNSADNPANPDPKATVRYGEQTWEEMMIGYLDWSLR